MYEYRERIFAGNLSYLANKAILDPTVGKE